MKALRPIAVCVAASLAVVAARAETVADFYRGKTITLMVSGSAGGGYDTLARAIARYLGRHVPGDPAVVVKNVPGAGGLVLVNQLFHTVPRDGTALASLQNNAPFEPLYGTREADYDARQMIYIGSPSAEVALMAVWNGSSVKTLDDARAHEVTMGASGQNSTPSFYGRLANETLGTRQKIVLGYPGQNEALLAMERGEIDGYPSAFYNSLMAIRPTWIAEGKVRLLVQFGAKKEPAIESVPLAADLARNDDDRRLIEAASAPLAIGRPYAMPPGVPADRVAAMRRAFAETLADPEFVAENIRSNLGANRPQPGEELEATIGRTYDSPPQVVERLRQLAR